MDRKSGSSCSLSMGITEGSSMMSEEVNDFFAKEALTLSARKEPLAMLPDELQSREN